MPGAVIAIDGLLDGEDQAVSTALHLVDQQVKAVTVDEAGRIGSRRAPDLAALRTNATRIAVGVGAASSGQSCDRTSLVRPSSISNDRRSLADTSAFVEDPDAFARQLRTVLRAT